MEFACLQCQDRVHVALGSNVDELVQEQGQRRLESNNVPETAQESTDSGPHGAMTETQSASCGGKDSTDRASVERCGVARCRRCDGLFHSKCVEVDGVALAEYVCAACTQGVNQEDQSMEESEQELPLLVPVQVLGVAMQADDQEMASDDNDDDDDEWNGMAVVTTDIQVCTTCRQVHIALEDQLPCAQCHALGRLHRRCAVTAAQETHAPISKSPGRKRKRKRSALSKHTADALPVCTSCQSDGAASTGAIETRRLALLMKPDELRWSETCVTCGGEFCLHALAQEDDEDDDEVRSRLGHDTELGFQCRSCLSSPISSQDNVRHDTAMSLFDGQQAAQEHIHNASMGVEEGEGTVLLCDGCEGEFDMAKLTPPLHEIPEGDWFCTSCESQRVGAVETEAAAEPVVTEVVVTVLICDGCEGEFELSPLEAVPEGDWFCDSCTQATEPPLESTKQSESAEVPLVETAGVPVAAVATGAVSKPTEVAEADAVVILVAKVAPTEPSTLAEPEEPTDALVSAEAELPQALPTEDGVTGAVNLIECDGCDMKHDVRTIGPVSADVPKGDWFCDDCEATRKRRKKGYAAMKMEKMRRLRAVGDERALAMAPAAAKQQLPRQIKVEPVKKTVMPLRKPMALPLPVLTAVTLLICDGCEGEFDMATLNPPLSAVPKGDWFCSGCEGHSHKSASSNRRKSAASSVCASCATPVRWDRNAQRAASRQGGTVLCEPCAQLKMETKAVVHPTDSDKKRKRDGVHHQSHDGRVNIDPTERIFLPVPVVVSYGNSGASTTTSSAAAGNISAYGHIVCSDDEAGEASGDDDEHVIIVCEICLSEFNMIDVLGDATKSQIAPPRPWYCTPCVKRLKKNRKKKQRISKQMMLEMQFYGGLLRPTAAKFVDPIARALRGKKPTADEELLTLFELIGKHVGVMLSWDKHWVMGRVLAFDAATGTHLMRFDDESERLLPLFALPIVIGTAAMVEIKVPASQNQWWPAQVLKMNAIAERQLEQTLDDPSLLKAFRLVNLFSSPTLADKPSNVACWTPRHLCRSILTGESESDPQRGREYEMAKQRAVQEEHAAAVVRCSALGAFLRTASSGSDSDDVWHAVAHKLVGSVVAIQRESDAVFTVESYDDASRHHKLRRHQESESEELEEVDLLGLAGRVTVVEPRALAKVALVLFKAQRGIFETAADTTRDVDDVEVKEMAIVQNKNVSIRPPPPQSPHQCGNCGLPPVVDGDNPANEREASLVECVQCHNAFHSYCCDPPHDKFPLVCSDDGGAVLVDDILVPFVCRACVSCAGCDATTSSEWFRWRLPLQVVTLCANCVVVYDTKCQCAVCNRCIDEMVQDESPSLLKCSTCELWVHPQCEPDPHPAFRRRVVAPDTQEFELDLMLAPPDLSAARVDDEEEDDDEDEELAGKKSKSGSSGVTKPARLVDEDFAFELKFKKTYDVRVLHNYECLTCRQVRLLRVLHRLRLEDKLDLFKEPVTKTIAPTYFEVIKQPMDLRTMQRKVLDGTYKRVNFRDFRDDFELLCLNAVTFNSRDRDFLIWREAWRFYGQGQKVLRQTAPKSRMKQRGGKNYDALVLAAKRQLPNNSHIGKKKIENGGGGDGDDDDGEDDDDEEHGDEEEDEGDGDGSVDPAHDDSGRGVDVGDGVERERDDRVVGSGDAGGGQVSMSSGANELAALDSHTRGGGGSSGAADATTSALVKPTFERKRAAPSTVEISFTPQSELGSVPKPHSSHSFYVTMHSRSSSHAYAWIDVCGQCGTRGTGTSDAVVDSLVFCIDCGEGFHTFCAGVDEQRLQSKDSLMQTFWRCSNCEMCELCGKPHDRDADEDDASKWMVCAHCDRSFHGKCLLPAIRSDADSADGMDDDGNAIQPSDSFFCASCVHCKNCGTSASPASYSYDRELCLNCCQAHKSEQSLLSEKTKSLLQVWTADARKQRSNAEKCPMCCTKWTPEETDLIQCDACECWAHPLCDPVFVDDPAQYESLVDDPNAQYVCAVCRTHSRDHLAEISDMAKCQLFITKIQRARSLCDARWNEARSQMRQAQQWHEWKEHVAIYLYVLRIGEECVKSLAYRSVNFQDDWARVVSTKYKDLDVPAWLLQKASRYLRYKRYARGPRAAAHKLTRKNENFYSQQGVEKQKEPHAIATIAAQAASCAALVVCVHLLYGWSPLQRVVFHLLERDGYDRGQRLSQSLIKALLVENNETLEEEITTIKRQYERRAGKKHLLRLHADDEDDIADGREPEISPTGSSVSSSSLGPEPTSMEVDATPLPPSSQERMPVVATSGATDKVVENTIQMTTVDALSGAVDDNRFCALCFIVGDTPACGRLIYVELDQWVHLNCALWSAEVYEDTDGVLHKCQKALSRSKTNRCDGCGVLGATIGCSVSRCPRHYHFPCALDHGVVFLPSSETCCPLPSHVQQIAKKLEVDELTNMAWTPLPTTVEASSESANGSVDAGSGHHDTAVPEATSNETEVVVATEVAVDETISTSTSTTATSTTTTTTEVANEETAAVAVATVPLPPPTLVLSDVMKAPRRSLRVDFSSVLVDAKKRMNALHAKRQVGFRIGSLTVHSLGHVVIGNPSFYTREAVFPLGFRSTRIYWSSRAIATRCVYECVVTSTDVETRTQTKELQVAKQNSTSARALFKITASDDVENPIVAASPTEALLELRSRIVSLYEDATTSSSSLRENPFLRRRSWFSYGLLGHHFFGFGIPAIAREIETLPHVATTAIRRSFVLQRHRQQASRKRKRHAQGSLNNESDDAAAARTESVYVFAHRLPSATEMALAMREVEQVVEAEEHARISTGAVRTDGLEREELDEAELAVIRATRRRLNKDATRDSHVQLPSEKAAAAAAAAAAGSSNGEDSGSTASAAGASSTEKQPSGSTSATSMDLEHLPIAMQYRELRRRPFSERLEVRKSKIHGYGLFTKETFPEGSMIVEYQGQMISQQVADVREKQYEEQGIGSCYMFRLDERTIIDATRCGNLARFMNHSCDPKAFARVVPVENNEKKIVIFAKRTIEAGEEVTYDYKFPIEDQAIRCDCGAPNCIGRMN